MESVTGRERDILVALYCTTFIVLKESNVSSWAKQGKKDSSRAKLLVKLENWKNNFVIFKLEKFSKYSNSFCNVVDDNNNDINNNSNTNNSDSNSIFSSSIRDHSFQWKGKHHRYILTTLISWILIFSEKQHVCYYNPSYTYQDLRCLTVKGLCHVSHRALPLFFSPPNFFLFAILIPSVINSSFSFTLSTLALILSAWYLYFIIIALLPWWFLAWSAIPLS